MYDNARRNISNLDEINKLVEEYRKSLIIHEYEQALVSQRVNEKISEKELLAFYEKYKSQMILDKCHEAGFALVTRMQQGEWHCVILQKADDDASVVGG